MSGAPRVSLKSHETNCRCDIAMSEGTAIGGSCRLSAHKASVHLNSRLRCAIISLFQPIHDLGTRLEPAGFESHGNMTMVSEHPQASDMVRVDTRRRWWAAEPLLTDILKPRNLCPTITI